MGKHTVQTAVVSCPSDNSAELDNDDASGTKRGVMASNVATSLHASATSQESRPLIDCLLIIMGFGLCRAWIVSCLSASVASYSLRTDWVYLLAGAGAAALAAFAMTRYAGSLARMHEHLTDYMVGLILASIVCVPAATWLDSPTLLLLGLIVGGAGSGLLQVMWGERFAAQSLYYSLVCAPAAAIVTGIMLSLTTTSNQLVFVVLPLLSGLLLALECKRCRVNWKTGLPEGDVEEGMDAGGALHADEQTEPWSAKGAGEEAAKAEAGIGAGARTGTETNAKAPAHAGLFTSHQDRMRLAKDTAKLMVSIMTFSFLVRVFDAFPIVGDDPFDLFGGSGSFSLVLVGILFLVVSFLIKDRMNVTFLYRLSLPVMIAGLVAIALLFDQRTPASVIIIGIGYELFDILAWVLFSETARHRGWAWSPYVFGIGVASMYVGMAAGYVLSAVLHPLIESGAVRISSVALMAVLCLVVIAFLVLPESTIQSMLTMKKSGKKVEAEARQEKADAPSLSLEEKCEGVAQLHGLTPRELEVLCFLARGRTLSIIARDLHIAKNTARTHIEKIYQKTDIHKQQDLIDYVEDWDPLDDGEQLPAH